MGDGGDMVILCDRVRKHIMQSPVKIKDYELSLYLLAHGGVGLMGGRESWKIALSKMVILVTWTSLGGHVT